MRSRYLALVTASLAAAGTCRSVAKVACSDLTLPSLPASSSDARLLTITANEAINHVLTPDPNDRPFKTPISFCNVTVTLTHPGGDDHVYINLWLPLNRPTNSNSTPSAWNGRYLATGGGGIAAGFTGSTLAIPLSEGYATSSTEGGLTLNGTISPQTGLWGTKPDGSLNTALLANLSWRAVHDMVVVSKSLIRQYYGRPQHHAYYSGCSQGGRQGYASAAKYPDDFDGIMANAPAVSSEKFALADYWGPLVMRNSEIVPSCVLDAFQKDIVAQCDPEDGKVDGYTSDWRVVDRGCPTYNATKLVGTSVSCREGPGGAPSSKTITSLWADIVTKMLAGPKSATGESLWYGTAPGANFNGTALTTLQPNGVRTVTPFAIGDVFLTQFLFRNQNYNTTAITYDDFYRAWSLSLEEFGSIWGDGPISDWSAFRNTGSGSGSKKTRKFLSYVGLADEIIPPSGVFRFRENIERQAGGADKADDFYRLFLAPGVGHCISSPPVVGSGPNPVEPLNVLVDWVEKGMAPDTIPAKTVWLDGTVVTRDLCRFPKQFVYVGGDVHKAESFTCK